MARRGFGKGEYRYFKYPLPDLLGSLRTVLYPHLAYVANEWNVRMGIGERYPNDHASFLRRCHEAGLLLQYVPGDFNCLYQDLYGDLAFPIQVAILLSEPWRGFTGGRFVLTEQRPRMQSRAEVVPLRQGDAVAFAVHMGARITHIKPMQGFCAELGGALTIFTAIASGTPISTTHTIAGSIAGVGMARKGSSVRWAVALDIIFAWALTLPAAGLIAAMVYGATRLVV